MPVVLVHGVNTRAEALPARIAVYLDRYLAGALHVTAIVPRYTFWGDLGGRYRFGGRSRPRTRYRAQGPHGRTAEVPLTALAELIAVLPAEAGERGVTVTPTGYVRPGGRVVSAPAVRLGDLGRRELANYLTAMADEVLADDATLRPRVLIAIDDVVEEESLGARLMACADANAELDVLSNLIRASLCRSGASEYVAQGGDGSLSGFVDRVREGLNRAVSAPGYAVSTALAELRPRLDGLLERFVGDVFVYLTERTTSTRNTQDSDGDRVDEALDDIDGRLRPALAEIDAGPIQRRLMLNLIEAHRTRADGTEPLILITHSMGGQIAYDALTWFLPRLRDQLRERGGGAPDLRRLLPYVDFWAATASQVGLFEELGLFLSSDPDRYGEQRPVPFPLGFLGGWWNVWDHNDLLSYSVKGIVDGVDDEAFDSGRSMLGAHGAYLESPRFYRRLAGKVESHLAASGPNGELTDG